VIGTIAGIVFLNSVLLTIAYIIALIDFLKRCPICTCCMCKVRLKELLIIDPEENIEKEEKEIHEPKTPPPEPERTPTPPPREPTPEPTPEFESSSEEEIKEPTPEPSEEEI